MPLSWGIRLPKLTLRKSHNRDKSGNPMTPDLLILSATEFEMASFLAGCSNRSETTTRSGIRLISGTMGSNTFGIVITGPGVFNTVYALTAVLENPDLNLKPHLVIQTGIAGVFKESGYGVGDIAVALREHYIHTGVGWRPFKNRPLPFDLLTLYPESRSGIYPMDRQSADAVYSRLNHARSDTVFKIARGRFITVSTITATFDAAKQIYTAYQPVMESMEGAASAHVTALYGLSIAEVRAASNYTGERDKSNWNIELAVERVGWACKRILTGRPD